MDLKQIDFKTFSDFWVILLIFVIIICIIFFITGIKDKDVIVYSILVFVAAIVLFHSWKDNKHSKKVSAMSILLNFAKSTFPPIYTIIQLIFVIVIFSRYSNVIYSQKIPDVFQMFNLGLFVILLGQIGLMLWFLHKNIKLDKSTFQDSFLQIFIIVASLSTFLICELYVIINHLLTDG